MDGYHTRYDDIPPYVTKDGSEIRELMHPSAHAVDRQSLAEARVPSGASTHRHRHMHSEEIYHVSAGRGIVELGDERIDVGPGDSVVIPPGTPHRLHNTGSGTLTVLCCCSPPYRHEDTELL